MGWDKIVRSKEEGGLEIQLARAKNIALLTKLNWRMYHEKDAIWARVILNKYCSNHRRSVENLDKLPSQLGYNQAWIPNLLQWHLLGIGEGVEERFLE